MIDVASGEIVATGLSMPHSPRLYRGELWLLNSGTGEFAVIGLSLARESRTFSGLDLDAALAKRDVDARCGLAIIDLNSGDMVHWVRIDGVVRELYDVAHLAGIVRPSAIGFKTDEVKRVISIDE